MAGGSWLERLTDLTTLGVGLAAVVVAGVVLFRTTGPDLSSEGSQEVSGWQRYADVGHRLGPETAAVTIIEFGDYQCPYCRAAECAGKQDRFWEFHEMLYSTATWIADTADAGLAGLAERAGVGSVEEFARCLADPEIDNLVNADVAAGRELGIRGTPTFLVNGVLHAGVLDSLRFEVLFAELGEG